MRERKRCLGISLFELLVALIVFSFIVATLAVLFNAGERQQRLGRNYSQAQSDLRAALRRATRAIRHAYRVIDPSTKTNFPVAASNAGQVIVEAVDPGGAKVQFRFHRSNGILYMQREDEVAPGTPLMTGVQSLTFNYFLTTGTTRTAVDANPSQASEVQITLQAQRGNVLVPVQTLVTMRNFIAGL